MSTDVDMGAMQAALEAVPVAAVIVNRAGDVVWANAVTRKLAGAEHDVTTSRLIKAIVESDPVRAAVDTGAPAAGEARLPTDVGLVDRVLMAHPIDNSGPIVVSFSAPGSPFAAGDDEVRQRLEAMLEHTAEMITVLDRDGTIRFSNAAAGRLTGLSGADANGRFAFDLIHPDDLERVSVAFAEALATPGPSRREEFRVRFADGRWHDIEGAVNNLLDVEGIDGLVVSMRDITDRKAAETRREALIANLSDVIVVINDQFEITYTSDSISRVIDAPPETNLGMSAFNDIHPDDLPVAIEALGQVSQGEPGDTVRVEIRLESRPGSGLWRWVEATAVNLLGDPAVEGIVITLHDVTEQKAAAQQLQQAYEQERANAERLAQLDRLKDEFLATVSHELRTPLAAIVGFADLVRSGSLDDTTKADLITRISSSAADMRTMIDNVLDFSALEAGRITLDLEPVDLRSVVDNALSTVAHQLAAHVVVDEVGEETVIADEHGLGHVVRNLLTNAAKYSGHGTTIRISTRLSGDRAMIEVSDQGIGISSADAARIFDRFYRAPSASFTARGSGVGLNIAKRYVELMHGSIAVRSIEGEGSTFTIDLPAAPT
ncbi:MAG TPA: PAS domain S-box protein [Acidimicrobiales bacterium]|nr:PAS domain S-box protein [Acidimicrobiales bacterium]